MLRIICFALGISFGLYAQSPRVMNHPKAQKPNVHQGPKTELGPEWITVPPQDGAPSFRYQIRAEGNGFHLHVLVPTDFPKNKWVLQQWTGDPRMVALRQKHLAELRDAARRYRELQKERDHAEEDCQERLEGILSEIEEAQRHFRDYDPFHQAILYFEPQPPSKAKGLEQADFGVQEAQDKTSYFVSGFIFNKDFDVAGKTLSQLCYKLQLVPTRDLRLRAVTDPWKLQLEAPWSIESELAKDEELISLLGAGVSNRETESIYRATPEGYKSSILGAVQTPACYGVEGRFTAPDIWKPFPSLINLSLPKELEKALRISYLGTDLVVEAMEQGEWSKPRVEPLSSNISSDHSEGDQNYEVLGGRTNGSSTYLLLKVTGLSRPSSPGGMCGGGEEVDLIWLRIQGNAISASNSELIESCFQTLGVTKEGESEFGHTWTVAYPDHSNKHGHGTLKKIITYSNAHPERGLWVEDGLPSDKTRDTEAPKPIK